jgi:hypothetical protein
MQLKVVRFTLACCESHGLFYFTSMHSARGFICLLTFYEKIKVFLAGLHTSLLLPSYQLVQCLQFLLGLFSTGTASCDMCTGLLTWTEETKLFPVFSKIGNTFPLVLRHPNSVHFPIIFV